MKINKIISLFEYLLCFALILTCRTVFEHNVNGNIMNYVNILIIFCLLILIIFKSNLKFKTRTIIQIILLLFYFFIYLFLNVSDNYISFIKNFIIILPLLILYFSLNSSDEMGCFLKKYSNIVYILAICSLFFFLIGSCLHLIKPNTFLTINWGSIQKISGYFYLHFDTQTTVFFKKIFLRNTGIFVEGPQYSLHLICAYVFTMFENKKIINKKSIIFFITLCTTLSITGILIFIMMNFYKYIKINQRKSKILIIPIILILGIFVSITLINDKTGTRSYKIREDDARVALISFKNNPLFGDGYMNNNIAISNMSSFRSYNTGLSNSFLIVLIQGGLYLSFIYFGTMILAVLKSHKLKDYLLFSIGILQILLYFTTTFQYTAFMMLFIAFNINYILKKNEEEKYEI